MMRRLFAVCAALACGISVALGAYASHVADGRNKERLALAAIFAFGHGIALLASETRQSRLAVAGKLCWLAGIVAFSGGLVAAALLQISTVATPIGGSLLMIGWLLLAIEAGRESGGRNG